MGKAPRPDRTSLVDAEDPWKVVLPELEDGPKFWDLTALEKFKKIAWFILRILILLAALYFFVCALSFLSAAFRLVGGVTAGKVLNNHAILSNPIAGLMIGVLVTVLVQSSSTSTSIVVAMVGSGIIEVKTAIPVVMGANIGTSVTNTIVALGQIKEKNEFRRAFGGATVHDMFNWLSVLILLPLEVVSGYLFWLSNIVIGDLETGNDFEVEILSFITDPFTKWVIQIDKQVITAIAEGGISENDTVRILKTCHDKAPEACKFHWFAYSNLSDTAAGLILLVASIALLLLGLVVIVKTLHSLLKGSIARIVHKVVNYEFPGRFAYFTGYLAIITGAICTFLVQSSSIFTSAITPLVGIGIISLERMYPLTLGANIGTTATGLIAALAVTGNNFRDSLQIAVCHLLFNITGILIWYPFPWIRFPIPMARILGNTTAKYRWFAIFYLIVAFFLLPAAVFGLSAANENGYVLMGVGIPFLVFLAIIIIINVLQRKTTLLKNTFLKDWEFLPKPLHSLRPYHNACMVCCSERCSNEETEGEAIDHEMGNVKTNGTTNPVYVTEEKVPIE
ncbi:Sodium-dependent phosphate transport protein 2A [Holothuria leucospilota]|uniref:Sodium-dependent phosphate transport protein 2A n=1 Tax=Holothuria leucospilota TaxID=206669 RepID=A0A9Q1H1T7_HOLLE|nr:Sodium-dependent phosphate transport protein 2A [Holothuria leucospilota]